MAELAIPIHDLDAGGREFRFVLRPSWMRGALEGTEVAPSEAEGELNVRASKSGTDIVVRGRLRAELTVPCARCLEPAQVAVRESVSALAVPVERLGPKSHEHDDDEQELGADEADMIPYDGDTVVLDDLVRDELLLAVPMIPLCSEACPGISPKPSPDGAAAAVDPRLQPLLRLKKT